MGPVYVPEDRTKQLIVLNLAIEVVNQLFYIAPCVDIVFHSFV